MCDGIFEVSSVHGMSQCEALAADIAYSNFLKFAPFSFLMPFQRDVVRIFCKYDFVCAVCICMIIISP